MLDGDDPCDDDDDNQTWGRRHGGRPAVFCASMKGKQEASRQRTEGNGEGRLKS
jgi:hypothetical protein